jgi:hypothetical protein
VFAASGSPAGSSEGIAMVSGSGYFGFLAGPPAIGLVAQATSLRIAMFMIVALSFLTAAALADSVHRPPH